MWEDALRGRLKADADVMAACTGVDWTVRKQGTALPRLVLQTVSDPREQHLKGFMGRRGTRVQFDCLAESRTEAIALREAAITAVTPAVTYGGIEFGRALFDPVRDLGSNTETGFVHRDSFDAIIWHD